MSKLRYPAVLFDLDGTLVDSYVALADAVNFARGQHGLGPLHVEQVKTLVGNGVDTLLRRAFNADSVAPEWLAAFEDRYDAVCEHRSFVLDDVHSTLEKLLAAGASMAVCTNKPTAFSKKILDALGLSRFFKAVVGPDLAGARKPDSQHVLYALAATGQMPFAALFVGDMPVDVEAARNSGLDVAVVATGSATASQLAASRADHYLDRFSDLVAVVRDGVIPSSQVAT